MTILRNALAQIIGLPISWTLSVIFMVIVPRAIGATELGKWSVAWAVCLIARSALDTGTATVLLKDVARTPSAAATYLASAVVLRVGLSIPLIGGVLVFAQYAGYDRETVAVIALIAVATAIGTVAAAATFTLQAQERIHLNALAGVVNQSVLVASAVVLISLGQRMATGFAVAAVVAAAAVAAYQFASVRDVLGSGFTPSRAVMKHMLRAGLPYWAGAAALSLYVWIDSVILSMLTNTAEVGRYSAATQIIAALGFLPSAISAALFPVLARTFLEDRTRMTELAIRGLRALVVLGVPMAAGLCVTAPALVALLYGPAYSVTGSVLAILAVTLVPVYIATLFATVLITSDRQVVWTWTMGALGVGNIVLNFALIPLYSRTTGHGAIGAAVSLLITDAATGIAAVALARRELRTAARRTLAVGVKTLVAAAAMLIVVWPLRNDFVVVPIVAGAATYLCAAFGLRVFDPSDMAILNHMGVRIRSRLAPGTRAGASEAA